MFLYGYHPVREALRHRPHQVARVLVSTVRQGRRRQEIADLCGRHGVPFESVPERALAAFAGPAHNGMAAELRPGGRLVSEGRQAGEGWRAAEPGSPGSGPESQGAADPDLVVLLEDVQDPRNLGAVLRVCEGAGVGQVLIRDRGSAPITPAVAKTAAGASEWLPIERITNSAMTLESLKKAGFWAYGTDPAGQPPWQIDLTGKVVLCFGGEEKGLRDRTRNLCDGTIGLPMRGRLDSLNLATAAAAILYEALRQRSTGGRQGVGSLESLRPARPGTRLPPDDRSS
ncbi:MAG TPA: RNA methyltransferase [Thermoanaerobaculia bacterium]|nr:RNA methyltransferase [Thermoanaerobaculia bacterium]